MVNSSSDGDCRMKLSKPQETCVFPVGQAGSDVYLHIRCRIDNVRVTWLEGNFKRTSEIFFKDVVWDSRGREFSLFLLR